MKNLLVRSRAYPQLVGDGVLLVVKRDPLHPSARGFAEDGEGIVGDEPRVAVEGQSLHLNKKQNPPHSIRIREEEKLPRKRRKRGVRWITIEVGWIARFLMQESLVLPVAAQLPQYKPVPQSRAEEHEPPT